MKTGYETVIIGGGPAGLSAACCLAKAGRSVCVLEQKKEIGRPVCCGEAISAASLEKSGFFDGSYIDSKVSGFRVFFPNNMYFSVDSPGYLLNRDKFEKYLAARAEQAGAKIFLRTRVTGMDGDRGMAWVNTPAGTVNAEFIIGADGPSSVVERAFFSNSFHSLDAMQFKIKKEAFPYSCGGWLDFYYDTLSPYYFWVFEKQDEFNVGGLVNDRKILLEFIKKHFPAAAAENAFFSRGKIPMHWIKKNVQKNRAFLAGDAAGLTNPVTFAGIYTALESGKAAAESVINYENDEPAAFYKRLKKAIYLGPDVKKAADYCYKYPGPVLDFIGDYFRNRDYKTVEVAEFLKLAVKTPSVFGSLSRLLAHRRLLLSHRDDLW